MALLRAGGTRGGCCCELRDSFVTSAAISVRFYGNRLEAAETNEAGANEASAARQLLARRLNKSSKTSPRHHSTAACRTRPPPWPSQSSVGGRRRLRWLLRWLLFLLQWLRWLPRRCPIDQSGSRSPTSLDPVASSSAGALGPNVNNVGDQVQALPNVGRSTRGRGLGLATPPWPPPPPSPPPRAWPALIGGHPARLDPIRGPRPPASPERLFM